MCNLYPESASWKCDYKVSSRLEPGQRLDILITVAKIPLPQLVKDLEIEVEQAGITADPTSLKVGEPFDLTVTGLDRFIGGYTVRISNGPTCASTAKPRSNPITQGVSRRATS